MRHTPPDLALETVEALLHGGVRAIEVTCNSAGVFDVLRAIAARFGEDVALGAGTVLDADMAARAIDAGARYAVSPHTDVGLIETVTGQGVAFVPGALSPSEILAAWRAGASVVKLFPAGAMGPSFVKDVRGPLPEIPLLPTEGVSLANRCGAQATTVPGDLEGLPRWSEVADEATAGDVRR